MPTEKGVQAEYVVEFGTPADRIVHFANTKDIDLVVIGTHGRTGVTRLIMGSVAEAVVRRSTCPVLAVKSPTKVLQEAE